MLCANEPTPSSINDVFLRRADFFWLARSCTPHVLQTACWGQMQTNQPTGANGGGLEKLFSQADAQAGFRLVRRQRIKFLCPPSRRNGSLVISRLPSMSRRSASSARCAAALISTLDLDHAAEHRFQARLARRLQRCHRRRHAAGLEKLHIHAVKKFRATRDVRRPCERIHRRTAAAANGLEPAQIRLARVARHRLFDELDVRVRAPAIRVCATPPLSSSSLHWRPHAQAFPARRSQSGEIFAVRGAPIFDFRTGNSAAAKTFLRIISGRVNADAERGDMVVLAKSEPQKIVQRPARALRRAIHSATFRAHLAAIGMPGQRVEIRHAAGHVGERKAFCIHPALQTIISSARRRFAIQNVDGAASP